MGEGAAGGAPANGGVRGAVALLVGRLDAAGSYLGALLILAASRIVVYLGVDFGPLLLPEPYTGKWSAGQAWYYRLVRWDGRWYAGIVTDGYHYSDTPSVINSVNFFPLYPLVSRAVKALPGVDPYVALLLVANLSSVAAVLLLTKFAKDEIGEDAALPAVTLFCFFPSSVFLSAAYTESLCLVLVLLSLMLMRRGRLLPAATMAGISLAARSTSIVLAPVLVLEMLMAATSVRALPRIVLCGLLALSGLLVYMAYLWIAFGHPLAFVASQDVLHSASLSDRIVSALTFAAFRRAEWQEALQLAVFIALVAAAFRRLHLTLALYGIGAILMPYLLDGVTRSTGRYLLMCIPAFLMAGLICRARPWLTAALTGLLAALLFQKTALFSQWYWEG